MTEHGAQIKRDEEYPLLKAESGGGDNVMRAQVPLTIGPSGWHVTCTPKQSWCGRWPEFVSACWMTTILLAISFLVFYALGMSAYRRQPVVIVRCNDSKPASEVFYHHIISRDAYVPLSLFTDYLSYMAKQYPLLHFKVYFLIDDSWQNPIQDSRHIRFIKRLIPQITRPFNTIFGQNYKREIRDFQRRYENVNISVTYLSKYMAMTPLRYKWRIIPPNYLSFYARIYAIWQNGGIGFDLTTFNNQFNHNQAIHPRLDAILKQHNDGIMSEKNADTSKYLDNQDKSILLEMVFNIINEILNETSLFFGGDNSDLKVTNSTPVIKTHRSKRDITSNNTTTYTDSPINVKVENQTNDNFNETNGISEKITNLYEKKNISKENNNTDNWNGIEELINQNFNVFYFYNISGFLDDIGPSYSFPKPFASADFVSIKSPSVKYATIQGHGKSKHISLTPEGHFVAASSRHHPFLAQLFSSGCQRVSPQFAIRDTLFSQCSGIRDDTYCENIDVMYNIL